MGQQNAILIIVLCGVILALLAGFAYRVHVDGFEKALMDAINAASRWGREVGIVAGPVLMELLLDNFETFLPERYLRWIDFVRGGKSRREWLRDTLQRLFDRSTPLKEMLAIQGPPVAALRRSAIRVSTDQDGQ